MIKTSFPKLKFRILPLFIFVAVLGLSIKLNTAYDLYQKSDISQVRITPSSARAADEMDSDAKALTEVLDGQKPSPQAAERLPVFSDSEIQILQELAERREALDVRAQEIDKRTVQLQVAEEEIDKKLTQLKEYEQRLSKLINQYSAQEKENINSLVKLYSSMKPKDAARIFNTMNLDISVAILKGMKPSASSAILSQMDSEKAQAITAVLIGNNL
ncbi:MAG: hypothetical protein IJ529_05885 [Alphaproteobacteria bacterium]|nr:hypothetical protein [Alphaproteobacteria bacterium]MBQ9235643.1 hypothetical protein [Alphaproteobacteria bacterium]